MTLPPKMEHFRISQREIPIYCLWQCNFDYKIAGRVGDPPLQKLAVKLQFLFLRWSEGGGKWCTLLRTIHNRIVAKTEKYVIII